MVASYEESKLSSHGLQFRNWPGRGEADADKFGMSHAVIVPAGSSRIIVGGQIGARNDGSFPDTLEEEFAEAFENVKKSLQAAGLGEDAWEHVYQLTIFALAKPGVRDAILKVLPTFLKKTRPAEFKIPVTTLLHPKANIEVAVEAYLPK